MASTEHVTRNEYLLIELLRGLAAAMVLYTHFWAFSETDNRFFRFAHTGVDLFFVLSGYVFGPYLFGKELSLVTFWLRRFFRIYPLYLLALMIYIGQKHLNGDPLLYVLEHLSFSFFQSKTMAFYYNPPFWSLPAEVEFYLLLPLFAFAIKRWPLAGISFFVIALLIRGLLGQLADFSNSNQWFIVLHHLPGLAIEFSLGIGLWRLIRNLDRGSETITMQGGYLIFAGIIGWATLASHFAQVGDEGINTSILRGQMGLLAAGCYTLMLAGLLILIRAEETRYRSAKGVIAKILNLKLRAKEATAIWSGKLSYGIYLLHMAALNLMDSLHSTLHAFPFYDRALWATFLTIFGAAATHIFWEDPLRRFGRRLAAQLEQRSVKKRRYPLA